KALLARSESLFKPRGSVQLLNKTLAELKAARDEVRKQALPSSEWASHDTALRQAEHRQAEVDRQLIEARREAGRLNRLEQALPLIARWRSLQESLATVQNAPRLPDDFPERRR